MLKGEYTKTPVNSCSRFEVSSSPETVVNGSKGTLMKDVIISGKTIESGTDSVKPLISSFPICPEDVEFMVSCAGIFFKFLICLNKTYLNNLTFAPSYILYYLNSSS